MKNTHYAGKKKTNPKKPTQQKPKEVYVYVAFQCRLTLMCGHICKT